MEPCTHGPSFEGRCMQGGWVGPPPFLLPRLLSGGFTRSHRHRHRQGQGIRSLASLFKSLSLAASPKPRPVSLRGQGLVAIRRGPAAAAAADPAAARGRTRPGSVSRRDDFFKRPLTSLLRCSRFGGRRCPEAPGQGLRKERFKALSALG